MGADARLRPKCLTPIGTQTIIDHTVDGLTSLGATKAVVVTGHLADDVEHHLTTTWPAVSWQFVRNPDYATTNNMYSLWCVRHCVDTNVVMVEADVMVNVSGLQTLAPPNAALVSPLQPWMDGSVATVDDNFQVTGIVTGGDRPIGQHGLKTVNAYSFDAQSWHDGVVGALERRVDAGDVHLYYEVALADAIADRTLTMRAAVIEPNQWSEVDCPDDITTATRHLHQW